MKKIIYDIECLPNCFITCLYNIDTGKKVVLEISERKDDRQHFVKIFNNDAKIFFSFNGIDYDGVMITFLLLNINLDKSELLKQLKELNDNIIVNKISYWRLKQKKLFYEIDLLRMLFSKYLRVGLKELQVSMFYPNVLEMEVDWDKPIDVKDIDELISYCWNDVDSTYWVYLRCINDLNLRRDIQEEWGLDCYSQDGMTLGVNILAHEYCKASGLELSDLKSLGTKRSSMDLKDIILPWISFDTKELQDFLDMLKQQTIVNTKGDLSYEVTFDDVVYGIGTGGIHSRNFPTIFETNDEYDLIDGDVDSLYPTAAINFKFIPEQLGEVFLRVYKRIRDERLEAKKRKKESKQFAVKNETFKLALNGAVGNFNQEFSWLYDPKANMQITVNNQLLILKWIEMLTINGFKVISANTDGITTYVKKTDRDRYFKTCELWCNLTGFTLEFTEYKKLIMFAVNDYVAIKNTNSTKFEDVYKFKGATFLQEARLGKGMKFPLIIPKALFEYYAHGTDYKSYILNYKDIKHFTRFEKTGKQFKVEWGGTPTQRINRFYVSTDGKQLMKINDSNPEKIKKISILKDIKVTLLNKFDDRDFDDYNLDHQYYIDECAKIINKFKTYDPC